MDKMTPNTIYCGDALSVLSGFPDACADCCVTSPPYFNLRDYGASGQIGLEETPEEYVAHLVAVFDQVKRVLKPEGTLWLNIGDSYAGSNKGAASFPDNAMNYKQGTNRGLLGKTTTVKQYTGYKKKDLIGIPWMVAFALRDAGWWLRQDIIWAKPNPMVESITDRCTRSHEYIFLLSKSKKYHFDAGAISEAAVKEARPREEGNHRYGGKKYTATPDKLYRTKSGNIYAYTGRRNKRDVWTVPTARMKEAHFATYPEDLVRPCILAGCPKGGIVLDPFMGSGTTAIAARKLGRSYVGVEINPEYADMARRRVFNMAENLFSNNNTI